MIKRFCSRGCDAAGSPLTWTVWAWNDSEGTRHAYKQKLCLACVASKLAPLHVACESPEMKCPGCGIDTAEDYDAVYVTFIPRGVGTLRAEAPFCAACAAHMRIWAMEGAERLEDREPGNRGASDAPRPSATDIWDSLGLRPRE